jgi:hypothetical protein
MPQDTDIHRQPASPDGFFVQLVKGWIWLSALAGLAGWTLSALGELNRAGYVVFFAVAAGIVFLCRRRLVCVAPNWRKLLRRFRRPLPGAFAVLAMLVFAGGAIYPPSNYTGLNYHLGRILQWLSHGQWWWIHTPITRMNFSGCAFEWLTTPLVLFTKSDRALFLVNFVPFLLLPGLIFSVFTRLGVPARVARQWMWLLPAGYNLLLQAGSIGNDAFGAVYALAAIDFGCRAWETRRIQEVWLSLLAVALLTGTKPTNLPLVLPWAILVLPLWPLLRRHWRATLPIAAWACVISFFPIALMNQVHTQDWLGRPVEPIDLEVHQPLIGLAGNVMQLGLDNLLPPVFPLAGWWNQHLSAWLPHSALAALYHNFDNAFLFVWELPTEDWMGVGFGVSWLLAVSVLGSWWLRRDSTPTRVHRGIPLWVCRCVLAAAWCSLLAYSLKSGMANAARLITPYYLLLVPGLLTGPGQLRVIRAAWWRVLAGGVMVLALVVLVLSPDRPLWPAKTVLSKVLAQHPGKPSVARALQVYTVYSQRNDALAGVRELLPPDLEAVGFVGDGDDCDISLWRPFGRRRVEHFLITDPPEFVRSNVQYVAVGGAILSENQMTIDDWLARNGADLVGTTNIMVKASGSPRPWYVARMKGQMK